MWNSPKTPNVIGHEWPRLLNISHTANASSSARVASRVIRSSQFRGQGTAFTILQQHTGCIYIPTATHVYSCSLSSAGTGLSSLRNHQIHPELHRPAFSALAVFFHLQHRVCRQAIVDVTERTARRSAAKAGLVYCEVRMCTRTLTDECRALGGVPGTTHALRMWSWPLNISSRPLPEKSVPRQHMQHARHALSVPRHSIEAHGVKVHR